MRLKVNLIVLLLLGAINIGLSPSASATNVTFSQTFTLNTVANSTIVNAWESFRSRLSGSYNSFTWSSSNGASITVSDATKIQTLANALRAGTSTSTTIGAATWSVGIGCGGTSGYPVAVEFSNQGTCSCAAGYSLRPLIGNPNWGGSNGSTCSASTQTITITFFSSAPDTTAPTFTSSSSFSVAENIAISANAATIKVSESATVTISSGVDAALFNIITSDSVTALIRFKVSPNFEAPSDSGANNVYDLVLTATDPANNAGTQTITITVTDVVDTSSFNSLALAGSVTTATFRSAILITANVSVASRVTFTVNGKVLPGCKNRLTSGTGSSHSVNCNWRPSVRGDVSLTAAASPTGAGIANTNAAPLIIRVGNRTGAR